LTYRNKYFQLELKIGIKNHVLNSLGFKTMLFLSSIMHA
jgi:hypothetical protein